MLTLPIVDPNSTATCPSAGGAPQLLAIEPPDANCRGTFAMVSLGCPKNLVDSERMLGLLRQDGWQLVAEPKGADLVVVNTCAFIDASREESYGVVREMLDLKKAGGTRGVIVAGCLAERQKEKLLDELPGLDSVIGVFSRDDVAKAAERLIGGLGLAASAASSSLSSPNASPHLLWPGTMPSMQYGSDRPFASLPCRSHAYGEAAAVTRCTLRALWHTPFRRRHG